MCLCVRWDLLLYSTLAMLCKVQLQGAMVVLEPLLRLLRLLLLLVVLLLVVVVLKLGSASPTLILPILPIPPMPPIPLSLLISCSIRLNVPSWLPHSLP